MGKEIKIKFDVVKGADILRGLREQVLIDLKNEKTLGNVKDEDCIIIPVYDNKTKSKVKDKDLER